MKSFLSLSTIAIAAALVSVAAQAEPLTRADVQAELARAQAAGELDRTGQELGFAPAVVRKSPALSADAPAAKQPVRVETVTRRAEKTAAIQRVRGNNEDNAITELGLSPSLVAAPAYAEQSVDVQTARAQK